MGLRKGRDAAVTNPLILEYRRGVRRRRRLRRASVLLMIIAAVTLSTVAVVQTVGDMTLAHASMLVDGATANEAMWEKARAYNQHLYEGGQGVLGDAPDPFSEDDRPASETDEEYQSLLDLDSSGAMGTVNIPKINVSLPIRHGTGQKILAEGAGHMYGTSLPVGGENTHAVISAHNGMADALMFTHLDELKKGDPFYLHVAGRTLAYRIDEIRVILPSEFDPLLIRKGEDRVTLMTCTPYGVNTHRLLVSGLRASMPDVVPLEADAERLPMTLHDPMRAGAALTVPASVAYAAWSGHMGRLDRRRGMRHRRADGKRGRIASARHAGPKRRRRHSGSRKGKERS